MTQMPISQMPTNQVPINQIYVFGDSLSDVGVSLRLSNGNNPPDPPYFQGRFSNGRVWVEYLAEALEVPVEQVSNAARGGATTGLDAGRAAPGLLAQVQAFLQANPSVNADALYVLWAGANDYLQGRSDTALPVENLRTAIASLIQAGAQRFLVGNLPNLGQLPATRLRPESAALSQLTSAHNQNLSQTLEQLSQSSPEIQLVLLDINTLYQEAIANSTQYGFTNVTTACLSTAGICSQPNQFLFWDGIHPTTAAHRFMSEAARQAIEAAGIAAVEDQAA
ncbi:SGNH/GDSL hydrolase family protein [Pseudanabaena sp. FACHB-2040]|uniref:SGNH/GDSL hydrolase family protein n=1 Tax=Pseudanabaena sp. FACHB-2040 TaxID=2692859 RepID=UPI0016858FCA|nr:SGNH/GDSL hydrolase family protein [Pseudanabaena sp. FACHB-2040]MBD2256499.1 SGNH/GDSL hydrolase family protein [Pseudanabaena sp. FACHB-2040]